MFRTSRTRAGLATAMLAASTFGAAYAHGPQAKLTSADPAPDSSVPSPKIVVLKFSEEIFKNLSSVKLTDGGGHTVATMQMPAPDAKSLSIMPNATLASGQYTVSWTAITSDDNHKMSGTYHFTVK